MVKKIVKKFIPKSLLGQYHKILARLAAFWYGWPSRKLIVIGVTGTQGKSTVVNLIAKMLENAGFKVGITSTINFKIAEKEWINDKKMTMLGRFALQRLLSQMIRAGCQYAVIETSSEGIAQYRHLGIDYDAAVFTNLSPEHIESHGSFKAYKLAKSKLFAKLKNSKTKKLKNKIVEKVIIVNLDDEHADYFLGFSADRKIGYSVANRQPGRKDRGEEKGGEGMEEEEKGRAAEGVEIVKAENVQLNLQGSEFIIDNLLFKIHLLGKFNIYNALAAICVGISQDLDLETIKKGLEKVKGIPGRLEEIDEGQNFRIFVDYAHTPQALEAVYKTIHDSGILHSGSCIIHLLGACGGGRDKSKRPIMGRIAAHNAKYVIVTNEDPYDEDPMEIIEAVARGAEEGRGEKREDGEEKGREGMEKILDRKEAIKKALDLARQGDIVLITGKGSEQAICAAGGKKISWDDREVVRKLLKNQN